MTRAKLKKKRAMPARVQRVKAHVARIGRLDALCVRAVALIGEAGEINYPAAMVLIRALADEVPSR